MIATPKLIFGAGLVLRQAYRLALGVILFNSEAGFLGRNAVGHGTGAGLFHDGVNIAG